MFMMVGFSAIVFYSCEKDSDAVVDPNYISPFVSDLYKSTDTISTNSINPIIAFNISAKAVSNGGSNISSVQCNIYTPDDNLLATFEMLDNGTAPDSVSGDLRYSASISITGISCLQIGQYKISISAVNSDGLKSNLITSHFTVINPTNQPPYIYRLDVPDSVVRPVSGQFTIELKAYANDTNGVCDVDAIYFNAYRPNGVFIGRFLMNEIASGTFNYTNYVTPSTSDSSYGYFKYFFQAQDKSGALSTFAKDSINFIRPTGK